MREIASPQAMQEESLGWLRRGMSMGLVPTIGYLHDGHLSLMRWARERCDILVASVFVNPAQFGPGEDLDKYPADLARDAALAGDCGVDVLFCPRTITVTSPDPIFSLPTRVTFAAFTIASAASIAPTSP